MLQPIIERFRAIAPAQGEWSLRLHHERDESLWLRQGVLQPVRTSASLGAFIAYAHDGGFGYAATCDLSRQGLAQALDQARHWSAATRRHGLLRADRLPRLDAVSRVEHQPEQPWESMALEDKIALLRQVGSALEISDRIVDWWSLLGYRQLETRLITSAGGDLSQTFHFIRPGLMAVANRGSETQWRTNGLSTIDRQGGLEQLERLAFMESAHRVAEEALALLDAPQCPSGTLDLLLMPDQMALQIHESIGHPLELDRILGDERNYAGTSFVSPDMFGRYRYGSELLNVTFDPTVPNELASYAYDDEGTLAEKQYLIRRGILERPLGGTSSQIRAGLPGVANARASSWNRPPIDRMANLNLEPGTSPFAALVASMERGIVMESNRSWSIDDSRNKFQFGCELGRLVVDGEIGGIVRNPNYRGVSAHFWRSLAGVGDATAWRVHGVANCGKGEPNQAIHVGHAAPPCIFRAVQVFGGAG